MARSRLQHTIARSVAVAGRGYWSGADVRVEFRPADAGTGVVFVRDDLSAAPRIPALVAYRQAAMRRTILGAEGATVDMVEHVLAALFGLGIDNCEVGVTAAEMPGCDGSAIDFVDALDEAGIVPLAEQTEPLVVTRPVRCGDATKWIEARPPIGDGLSIEYRLDYGAGTVIGTQWHVVEVTPKAFRLGLAAARTFVLKAEADALVAQGLGAHVSPQELLIFGDHGPIDNELRYENECVRHKILDVVGDLALAGRPLVGHIVACRSGHRLNGDLVEALLAIADEQQFQRKSA
jgi:UDP-3-O-[3-hydroxymyristoyl] N-acetylglucosamine deacetylase